MRHANASSHATAAWPGSDTANESMEMSGIISLRNIVATCLLLAEKLLSFPRGLFAN